MLMLLVRSTLGEPVVHGELYMQNICWLIKVFCSYSTNIFGKNSIIIRTINWNQCQISVPTIIIPTPTYPILYMVYALSFI